MCSHCRFGRVASKDYFLDDIKIPKGSGVLIPAYVIQRSEEHYPEPDKWQPER